MVEKLNKSLLLTIGFVLFLFLFAIVITMAAPRFVDPSWTHATSAYQVQMYERADPNIYIAPATPNRNALQYVYHLEQGETLVAFIESPAVKITAPPPLQHYITHPGDTLKLTSRLLLLRPSTGADLELYDPELSTAFALAETDGIREPWSDRFELLDSAPHDTSAGTLYVANPTEYRVQPFQQGQLRGYTYSPDGERVTSLTPLGFTSREELIRLGEHIYAIEGCWYCHSDQSRTLIQDSVLNGTESYPAPPSSASEYIYQNVTFPATRRIGPDLARVGVKRPGRDWHLSHFANPKTASPGSIMPAFGHFFDDDPRGRASSAYGIPNWRFEALYQYLMTKGTRLSSPDEAWWEGGGNTRELVAK